MLQACSVENVGEVVLAQQLHVLLASGTEAVKEIVNVRLRELIAVLEASHVVINIVVLLNGLNDVALALELEELLSDHDVRVVHIDEEVTEVTIVPVEVGRVAEGPLVVGHGPLGSGHHAQVVVPVSVERRSERVLRVTASLGYDQLQK